MDIIKFANGERHECSHLTTSPNSGGNFTAHIAIADVNFAQAAAIFSDTSKTSEMECGSYRLVGYTELVMLVIQPYGIQATLRGGHDERIS